MAEPLSKRYREEIQLEENENEDSKRCKSYNHVLSLLDHEEEEEEEEEETTEDLSSIITTLQQEIANQETHQPTSSSSSSSSSSSPATILMGYQEDSAENEERERVMRLLLEASDDELGIPNTEFVVNEENGDGFGLNGAFWEMEDEVANYNLLLQSELFWVEMDSMSEKDYNRNECEM